MDINRVRETGVEGECVTCVEAVAASGRTDGRTTLTTPPPPQPQPRRVLLLVSLSPLPAEVFRVPRKVGFSIGPVQFSSESDTRPDPPTVPHLRQRQHEAPRPALLGRRRPLGRRRLPGAVFQGTLEPVQRRLESLQLLERRQPIRRRRHAGEHFRPFPPSLSVGGRGVKCAPPPSETSVHGQRRAVPGRLRQGPQEGHRQAVLSRRTTLQKQ